MGLSVTWIGKYATVSTIFFTGFRNGDCLKRRLAPWSLCPSSTVTPWECALLYSAINYLASILCKNKQSRYGSKACHPSTQELFRRTRSSRSSLVNRELLSQTKIFQTWANALLAWCSCSMHENQYPINWTCDYMSVILALNLVKKK